MSIVIDVNTYYRWNDELRKSFDDWMAEHGYDITRARIFQVDITSKDINSPMTIHRYDELGKTFVEQVSLKTAPPGFV